MSAMDVSDNELREVAEEVVKAAEQPTTADVARAGDYLRAAEFARNFLMANAERPPERLSPFRCLVLGYLAALKDRT